MTIQKHPYGYWTDERIIEESKKYKTPIEFKINAPTAYKKANEKNDKRDEMVENRPSQKAWATCKSQIHKRCSSFIYTRTQMYNIC